MNNFTNLSHEIPLAIIMNNHFEKNLIKYAKQKENTKTLGNNQKRKSKQTSKQKPPSLLLEYFNSSDLREFI